jgi:FtsZ-binding cell division protein ZapB
MPDTVKSLKLENEELKTQVNMLRKEFKNLEVTLERRIAQSNDTKSIQAYQTKQVKVSIF